MFDIHKVKPVHGWREFVGEVGIIVLGVLIALSAESGLEWWHWREQVARTRIELRSEIFDSAINAWERQVVAPCLRNRLIELRNGLLDTSHDWSGSPMHRGLSDHGVFEFVVPPAYAPPSRIYNGDAWKNTLYSGAFNHFRDKEAAHLSEAFTQIADLSALQDQEAAAAAKLSPLSFPRKLSDRDRSDALANVAEVDRTMTLMGTIDEQFLASVKAMKFDFSRATTLNDEDDLLKLQSSYRGRCISRTITYFD